MTDNSNNAVIEGNSPAPGDYQGDDKLSLGMVLAVITFWLFAQTTLNVAPAMRDDLGIEERSKANAFIDFNLFKNSTYTGAALSNFLLNGAAGTLLVSLTLVQKGAGLSSFQAGLLTLGYLIAILSTIRVGERLLQKWGPRKPMMLGCGITAFGILLTSMTFLYSWQYMIAAVIGLPSLASVWAVTQRPLRMRRCRMFLSTKRVLRQASTRWLHRWAQPLAWPFRQHCSPD